MNKLHELMQIATVFGLSSDTNMYGEGRNQYRDYKPKPLPIAPSDKQKLKGGICSTFSVHGVTIEAASRKDAIKKFNRLKEK